MTRIRSLTCRLRDGRRLAIAAALALLAATAPARADSGRRVQGDVVVGRLALHTDQAWSQFDYGGPYAQIRPLVPKVPTWTRDDLSIDALRFYNDLCDGCSAGAFTWEKKATPLDIVERLAAPLTKSGGTFRLLRLEPATFVEAPGFRAEYELKRAEDGLWLHGLVLGANRDGRFFMAEYVAPRLGFYPRDAAQVEAMLTSARLAN